MCGIVGAVSASTNIVPILVQGLQRLEYRGYDSCGVAIHNQGLQRARSTARVKDLLEQVAQDKLHGTTGIAHTRWATHGAPEVCNAHPHFSYGANVDIRQTPDALGRIALVHNGIIENHDTLRSQLQAQGYQFLSQTDTEVIAHLIDSLYTGDIYTAVQAALSQLHGAYAVAVICHDTPQRMIGGRAGSPLIIGIGEDGTRYLASDAMALAGVTDQIIYLEEGDIVDIQPNQHQIQNAGQIVTPEQRPVQTVHAHSGAVALGTYKHYMQKEIFEQPRALADTLEGINAIEPEIFGQHAAGVFSKIDRVLILACGTSYYSGTVAKYWIEALAGIPTDVEIASEYRYRTSVPNPNTLVVTISQSGETADTLSALRHAKSLGMTHTLTICNVSTSAMVRECTLAYITRAGVEIGVASTKAFTTQLAGLFLLTLALGKSKGSISAQQQHTHLQAMRHLPLAVQSVLELEPAILEWAQSFGKHDNALFLGRGMHYPIALEGALKLKEISYIHAEAYPAGELKHGPLALVTKDMPVVVVAPNDELIDKLKSNMQEVRARGGELYVLADADTQVQHAPADEGIHVIHMPEHYGMLSPILHVVPLQLLAYHTACIKGTDVDKPRNLAKSVTVE